MTRDRVVCFAAVAMIGVALAGLQSTPASAEERKGSWEFGFLFGNNFYAKEQKLPNATDTGLRIGWNLRPAYELELQYMKTASSTISASDSTLIANPGVFFKKPAFTSGSYSLRLLINPRNERRRLKPFLLFGLGDVIYTSDPKLPDADLGYHSSTVLTLGGGFRQRLTGHMALRVEFNTEVSRQQSFHNEHLNAGLTWVFGGGAPNDSDGDGILDISDRCPDTPKGALVDKHDGCPWDLDGDGVMEGLDKCADTPRGWPVDQDGCPLDSDGDAVPDGIDKCADTPKGAIVNAEGCPLDSDRDTILDGIDKCPDTPHGAVVDPPDSPTAGCPHDSDNDGVPDGIDECALTPAGATVNEKGCPTDSDGDRALDGIDQCPDTPKGQKVDREGCPRVRLDKPEPQVLMNVKFLKGTEFYPGADSWLALGLDALTYWSDVSVEIGVYTDKGGNKAIAARRAEVVKAWLAAHGIEARRLFVKAYGPVNFIADNGSEEERDKNNRVELKRLSGDLRKHPKPVPEEAQPAAPEAAPAPQEAPAAPENPAPTPAPPANPAPTPAP